MTPPTDDLRIDSLVPLSPPRTLRDKLPSSFATAQLVSATRGALGSILAGTDDRLAVVVGPCSIHDPEAALDYADRLARLRQRFADTLEVVMRVYFEKPRTTVGWKGLINDPDRDGRHDIEKGLRLARRVLLAVNARGLPAGCEFLDTTTPQYVADLVSWGAIGARTTESQVHRELASGLSCPVGFKNGTDGNVRIAVDAIRAAAMPHRFLAVGQDGRAAIAATTGNTACHVILRGGRTPNYDAHSVASACADLDAAGLRPAVMIDASHANSGKKPENQPGVIAAVARQVASGNAAIVGVMVESNIVAGRQEDDASPLVYGQSITDGCIGWADTEAVLADLAEAVAARRAGRASTRPPALRTLVA